jgi:hypothetical protein
MRVQMTKAGQAFLDLNMTPELYRTTFLDHLERQPDDYVMTVSRIDDPDAGVFEEASELQDQLNASIRSE